MDKKSLAGARPAGAPNRRRRSEPTARELEWWATPEARTEPTTIERGAKAEERAARALEAEGYAIVERNWRCKVGELDIVARDGDVLVFVEVRSREDDSYGHAAEMVGWTKRRKVSRVAIVYLAVEQPDYETCRFDVVAITGDVVDIIRDAWRG